MVYISVSTRPKILAVWMSCLFKPIHHDGKINIHSTGDDVDFKYFIQLLPNIVVLIKSKINNTQVNETLAIFTYLELDVYSIESEY